MGYKAVSRIKHDGEYIERGDDVDLDDDTMDELLAAEAIMEEDEYNARFPETEESENQPAGTPSNLEEIPSELQAPGNAGDQGDEEDDPYVRDEDGEIVLDEDEDPTLKEGWEFDDDGNPVKSEQ